MPRRLPILVALAVLLVFVVVLATRHGTDHRARRDPAPAGATDGQAAVERGEPPAAARVAGPQATPTTAPRHAVRASGQRTLVPRPAAPVTRAAAPLVPRLQRGGELKDRRGGPRDEEQRQQIMAAMGAVEDDVEECLHAWSEVEPDLHGQVSLAFQIDDSGLGKVWIQDWADVPEGPMTCFASAVYGVDWSHISDRPIEISNHFVVEQGAPAQVDVRGPKHE